jgi:L-lactate utilization protein LutC
MNNDLHSYIHEAFQRHFASDLIDIQLHFLPHEVLATVRVNQILPEMTALAEAIEDKFEELDRQVSVNVVA